ncbi:hypothetical protein H5410_042127 [Solanum commersonii]|uniref:Uncharacterized protein n=1 Tax=Solanum commersonii TaxID=4109 RepID=A0A9J5XUU8_SOLCO|nr:hypothetical protein H5410_042127 [Solanum commersonii]
MYWSIILRLSGTNKAPPEVLHVAIESDLANGKQKEATESKNASDLNGDNSQLAANSKAPPNIFDVYIGKFLHPTKVCV